MDINMWTYTADINDLDCLYIYDFKIEVSYFPTYFWLILSPSFCVEIKK